MKKYIFFALFICANLEINAQANFSFNNLRDYVAQTQNINPVSLPNNTFTFGFPLNFSTNVYSDIKIKDFLTKNGNSLKLDLANLNDLAKIKNYLNLNTNISLAILSHKTKKGAFSFFANAKSNLNWQFSNNFTDVLSNGFENGFVFSDEKIQFTAYTEMGVGITRLFLKDKLAVGFRVKFLNGIAHAESLDDAYFSLDVNPENANWTIQASNVVLNTSGLDGNLEELNFSTNNSGFGFDIGANYRVNNKFSIEAALNDVGYINWTENVKNYSIDDTSAAYYNGVDLKTDNGILEEIESALKDIIGTKETQNSFKTTLRTTLYFTAKYKLSSKGVFTTSFFKPFDNFNLKPSYALGYNRTLKNITYGVLAIDSGLHDDITFGANFAIRLACFQLYVATDNVSSIFGEIQKLNSGNIQFGLNYLFGYK